MSKITVACLQLQAHDLDSAEEALEQALALIDRAGAQHPDLMILPECTYPAYYLESLDAYRRANLRPHDEVLAAFGARARACRSGLIVGIARPGNSGRLHNSAYVFDAQGTVIGTYSKSFLWHFDECWFDPGREYPTFRFPFGRTGVLICADGRMPEIARLLGAGGARLIADPTAWVTGGGDRATLSNPQFEYMIPTRAIENGVWIAVANKVGIEAETVVYCGRSCIVSPQGVVVAQAGPTREEYVLAEIDLDAATGVPVRRRPECYALLGKPTETLPVSALLAEPVVPSTAGTRIAALQIKPYAEPAAFVARVAALTETLVRQGATLLLLPGIPPTPANLAAYQAEQVLGPLRELSRKWACGLACPLVARRPDGKRTRTVYLLSNGDVIGMYDQMHGVGDSIGEWGQGEALPVWNTPYGRIGIMCDADGLVPEVARVLMLQGADLILWPAAASEFPLRMIARSRADENKVFVALATPCLAERPAQTALVNPAGALIAAALPDIEQGLAGQVAWALAHQKEMAPNTNVVWSRQTATYNPLWTSGELRL